MKNSQKQTLLVFLVGVLGVLIAAFGPRPLPGGNQHMRGSIDVTPTGNVKGISSSPNVKIAFYGDSHDGSLFRSVLTLMKNEASDAVVGVGDYDYSVPADPNNYETIINSVFNNAFPFFLAVGNHDISEDGDYWRTTCSNGTRGCYATNFLARLQRLGYSDISATMLNNQMYSLDYQGVKLVFVGDDNFEGKGDSIYAPYIRSQLQNDTHDWKVCVWHRTQNAMQLGTKGDSIGWQVYETCRQYGAIVITAHEHSYARTKTLSSIQNQIVDSAYPDRYNLRVEPGKTFVAISALGGQDIDRTQSRCAPTTYPYGCKGEWAQIYTKTQNAVQGALFLEFNVDGDPAKARGYFKNINGTVVDSFNITTTGSTGGVSSAATTTAATSSVVASTSAATSVATSVATSQATTSVGGLSGGNWYGANSVWNTPIPSNATYTPETRIGTFRPVYEDWSAPVYRVPATENPATVRVVNTYSGRVENWPIPTYALPAAEADAHMVVVFKERNIMYEMWAAEWVSSTEIRAGGMKDYPYNGTGISNPPNYRVTASGFAVGAGMVVKENFTNASGQLSSNMTINHALSMALPTSVISKTYIAPAVGGEEAGNNTNGLPMGAKLALPKNLNVDALNVHPMTKALLRAARDYGIYVNDGNGAANYNNKAVGTIRLEPGLTQALYGTANDDLLAQIGSEVYNVVSANGLYVVTGGTNTSTATTTSVATTTVTTVSSSSATTSSNRPAACKADYNGNGALDISDFATFAANYKKTGINCSLDIVGGNCYLDVADFSQFASIYKVAGACL